MGSSYHQERYPAWYLRYKEARAEAHLYKSPRPSIFDADLSSLATSANESLYRVCPIGIDDAGCGCDERRLAYQDRVYDMICRTSEDDLFKKANISREEYKSEVQSRKKASKAYALSKGQRSHVRKAMEAIREGIGAALQKASLKKNLSLRQLPKTRGDVIFSYYLLAPDEIDTWTSIQDAEDDSNNAVDMYNPLDGSWGVHFWEQDYDSPDGISAKAREAIKRTRSFITRKSTLLEGEVTIGRLNIGFVDFLCPRTVGLYDIKSDHSYEGHKVKVQFIDDDYLILDLDSTIFANSSGSESPWPSNVNPVRRLYGVTETKARSLVDQTIWEGGGTSQEETTRPPPRDRKTECKLARLVGARYNTRYSQWDIGM